MLPSKKKKIHTWPLNYTVLYLVCCSCCRLKRLIKCSLILWLCTEASVWGGLQTDLQRCASQSDQCVSASDVFSISYAALIFTCGLNWNKWSVKSPEILSVFLSSEPLNILISSLLASTGAGRGVSFKPLVRTVYDEHFKHSLLVKQCSFIGCLK